MNKRILITSTISALLILLSVSIALPVLGSGSQEPCTIHYSRIDHIYTDLNEKNGYSEIVSSNGWQLKNKRTVIDISFTEIEKVNDLEATYIGEGNKKKSIKEFGNRSLIGSSFYDGIRARTFVYEPRNADYPIHYSYVLKNSNLMFLSFLPFQSLDCVDTISYTIQVPSNLKLKYEISGDTSLLKNYSAAKSAKGEMTEYTFMAVLTAPFPIPDSHTDGIKPASTIPGIRLSIIPVNFENHDFAYMNQWYRELIKPQSELNAESIAEIKKWGNGLTGVTLIKALFDSVKMKIRYIAFENGIGAVQPRNVNEVLLKRQGDCKDMANLLRQSIRYFGIPAWIAVSSTLSHPYDLDFPCIASANHAICVAEMDGKLYYLDATESFGLFGYPSRQIQGKHILIVDSVSGRLVKIPVVPKNENTAFASFVMRQRGDKLSGRFSYTLTGFSRIDFETVKGRVSGQTYDEAIKRYLTSHFRNLKIDSLFTIINDTSVIISGFAEVENASDKLDHVTYLTQNMLMYPHSFPKSVGSTEKLIFYETMQRDFDYTIITEAPVQLRQVPSESFNKGGFNFRYSVSTDNPSTIRIRYSFASDDLQVDNSNRNDYNALHQLINKTFNKKIAYE